MLHLPILYSLSYSRRVVLRTSLLAISTVSSTDFHCSALRKRTDASLPRESDRRRPASFLNPLGILLSPVAIATNERCAITICKSLAHRSRHGTVWVSLTEIHTCHDSIGHPLGRTKYDSMPKLPVNRLHCRKISYSRHNNDNNNNKNNNDSYNNNNNNSNNNREE